MGVNPNELAPSTIGPTVGSDVKDAFVVLEGGLDPGSVHRVNAVNILRY